MANLSDYRTPTDFLLAHPELVKAAEAFLHEASKAGVRDPKWLLMGVPLTVPLADFYRKQGFADGYEAGRKDMQNAMEQALQWGKGQDK